MSGPTLEYILKHWITVQEAATRMGTSEANVTDHCRRKNMDAIRVQVGKRWSWKINPASLAGLRRRKR